MFQFSPKPQKERKLRVFFFFFPGGFTQQFLFSSYRITYLFQTDGKRRTTVVERHQKKKKERDFVRIDCHHVINNQ